MARSTGLVYDIRKFSNYEIYKDLIFNIPVSFNGDCFDRYLLRIEEMRQSLEIINTCIFYLEKNYGVSGFDIKANDFKFVPPHKAFVKHTMEALINHFKLYTEGFNLHSSEMYVATESPKGEFGVFLNTDGSNRPYRCKIRSPGFFHLQGLNKLLNNHMIADLVTIIGSLDIVFGEIDR